MLWNASHVGDRREDGSGEEEEREKESWCLGKSKCPPFFFLSLSFFCFAPSLFMHEPRPNEWSGQSLRLRVPPWYSSSKALLHAIELRIPHKNKWGDWSNLERKNSKVGSRCFVIVDDNSSESWILLEYSARTLTAGKLFYRSSGKNKERRLTIEWRPRAQTCAQGVYYKLTKK